INEERIRKIEDRRKFGKATRLAALQASSNLNQDASALANVNYAKDNLIKNLNFLMGMPAEMRYEVVYPPTSLEVPALEDIQRDIIDRNPQLRLAQRGIVLAGGQLELSKAQSAPMVSAFANLGYFFQYNDVQQLRQLQNLGGSVGLSARYNLWDGGLVRKRVQNAQLNMELSQMQHNQVKDQLMTQAIQQRNNMVLLKDQLQREQQNSETFEEAFNKTQDRYFAGKANALDLRDAQLARLGAQLRIDQLQVDLAKAKLELDKLRGRLVAF
ncbi:MAG: TolC family protein, partial [Bacteroidota bacterium]